jgi:hypothetical protein
MPSAAFACQEQSRASSLATVALSLSMQSGSVARSKQNDPRRHVVIQSVASRRNLGGCVHERPGFDGIRGRSDSEVVRRA